MSSWLHCIGSYIIICYVIKKLCIVVWDVVLGPGCRGSNWWCTVAVSRAVTEIALITDMSSFLIPPCDSTLLQCLPQLPHLCLRPLHFFQVRTGGVEDYGTAEGGEREGVCGAMLVDVVVDVCGGIVVVFLKEYEPWQNTEIQCSTVWCDIDYGVLNYIYSSWKIPYCTDILTCSSMLRDSNIDNIGKKLLQMIKDSENGMK